MLNVLRALRASIEQMVEAWTDAEDVWDLDDPLLEGNPSPQLLSVYD